MVPYGTLMVPYGILMVPSRRPFPIKFGEFALQRAFVFVRVLSLFFAFSLQGNFQKHVFLQFSQPCHEKNVLAALTCFFAKNNDFYNVFVENKKFNHSFTK